MLNVAHARGVDAAARLWLHQMEQNIDVILTVDPRLVPGAVALNATSSMPSKHATLRAALSARASERASALWPLVAAAPTWAT